MHFQCIVVEFQDWSCNRFCSHLVQMG